MAHSSFQRTNTHLTKIHCSMLQLATIFLLLITTVVTTTAAQQSHHSRLLRHNKQPSQRNLQGEDATATQFCGRTWGDAIADCSPATHCPNGNEDCDTDQTCHGYLPNCNINNMNDSDNGDSSSNGAPPPTPPPIRNEYDERNKKFCGTSWGEANDSCSLTTWCPIGNECTDGEICFGGIPNCNAYYLLEIDESGLGDGSGGDNSNNNNGEEDIMIEPQDIQCSPEVSQCPNGQYVARAPELNCDFYPCPVMPSTNSPSLSPVRQIVVENTFSPVVTVPLSPPSSIVESDQVEEDEVYFIAEEGDEDERVATLVPTLKPVATAVWVDNDTTTEEEVIDADNTGDNDAGSGSSNLWCGETRFDATRNCGRAGYHCPDGFCLGSGMSCFMIGSHCEEEEGGESGGDSSSSSNGGGGGAIGDVSDAYFCGVTHTDAVSSCHKRCRSGSPADCPTGESCFRNVYQCTVEIPRPDPTKRPTLPPTIPPSISPVVTTTQIPSSFPTKFPSFATDNGGSSGGGEPQLPPGLPPLLCASSYEELERTCATTAQSCISEPCPSGQMCYPLDECHAKGSGVTQPPQVTNPPTLPAVMLTLPPTIAADNIPQQTTELFCASTFEELQVKCSAGTAQRCGDGGKCPSGEWCYEYTCNVVATVEEEETAVVADAPEANPENNASVEQNVVEQPVVAVIEGEAYCASSIGQLNERCGLASPCSTDTDCSAAGEFCVKYTCLQNLMQCPLNFVGWHSSKDCKSYYYCEQGVASSTNSCGDGMKFDKTRGKCTTDFVDEFCYGKESYPHNTGPVTQPGTPKELCPPGYTGWHSSDGACNEYQKCTGGYPAATRVCGFGLKFDITRGECIDQALVNIASCTGPAPQGQGQLCPSGSFTGWVLRNACIEYSYCENGQAGVINTCANGFQFDIVSAVCKPAAEVNCGGMEVNEQQQVPNYPTLPIDESDSNSSLGVTQPPTTAPTTVQDPFAWSNTAPPTVPKSESKIPPWMFKQEPNGGVVSETSLLHISLFMAASIFWMLL